MTCQQKILKQRLMGKEAMLLHCSVVLKKVKELQEKGKEKKYYAIQ